MQLSNDDIKECTRRILTARLKILNKYGFYGLLLMHTKLGLDDNCPTAYTDGNNIRFSPEFTMKLTDSEIETVLMHEILHIVLMHCNRGLTYNHELFNIACDIVVNSLILEQNNNDISSITLSAFGEELMHIAPDNKEGSLYTAEEVYKMLLNDIPLKNDKGKSNNGSSKLGNTQDKISGRFDDHDHWKKEEDASNKAKWTSWIEQAYEENKNRLNNCSNLPAGLEREIGELVNPTIDWKKMLNDFLSFEINDYSFSPPDRRFDSTGFFLPDFNETELSDLNVWFVVDISGSMNKEQITDVMSEIKGALDQFNGKLKGYISYFDAEIYGPFEFDDVDSLLKHKPIGGGGTSFVKIFDNLDYYEDKVGKLPEVIVILTDGYCDFPLESDARKIPVFWLINNKVITPPWGIVGRFLKK